MSFAVLPPPSGTNPNVVTWRILRFGAAGGLQIHVRGTAQQAANLGAYLNAFNSKPWAVDIYTDLAGRGVNLRFANLDGNKAGMYARDSNTIFLDSSAINLFSIQRGANLASVTGIILFHELLHVRYGGHNWGTEGPQTSTAVYNDPIYRTTFAMFADSGVAGRVDTTSTLHGLVSGHNEYFILQGRVPAGVTVQSSGSRSYYIKGNNVYYIVDINEYITNSSLRQYYDMIGANGGGPMDSLVKNFVAEGDAGTLLDAKTLEAMKRLSYRGYDAIGSVVGSALGSALSGGDVAKGILYGSLLGEIGERLGAVIGVGGNLETSLRVATDGGLAAFGQQVAVRAGAAAIGTVSSWLSMELGEALGLEGFGAELFSTVGATVTNHIIGNLLAQGPNFAFAGISTQAIGEALGGATKEAIAAGNATNLASALASAVGAFIGARLGAMVVSPQTQAAVVLSSVGSAVGAYIGAQALGTWATAKFGSTLGNMIAPGIGAFVGFVLGALIGNLFGRKQKPKIPTANASTYLSFTSQQFELGSSSATNGGNLNLVVAMATSARDTLNGAPARTSA